jgi:hypothetical protein
MIYTTGDRCIAVKNGSQAANERFFDFPEIRLIC